MFLFVWTLDYPENGQHVRDGKRQERLSEMAEQWREAAEMGPNALVIWIFWKDKFKARHTIIQSKERKDQSFGIT